MPEISVVAKNRSSFNGIDITPDTTELTGLKINTWTAPTGASYGLYISPLTGATAKSLYLGNSIDIKNGTTGTITLSVPPSTSAGYTANSTHTVYLPTTGGTLITSAQAATLVNTGSTTATDLRPSDNLWTNKNTFQRTVAASLTITNATYNTLPKTYALNVEIGNDSTTDPASFALAGTANTYYVAMAQMRPIPLSLAANVTVTEASTLHIMGTPSKSGITGTAVNAYGLKISDSNTYASVPASGFTNGYGLYIIQPSEATKNYALALAADNSGTNFIARFYADQTSGGSWADRVVAEFGGGNLSTTLFSFLGTTANFSIASGGTANLFAQATPKTINIGTGATANLANITIGSNAGTLGTTYVYAGTTLTFTPVSTTGVTVTNIANNATVAGQTKTIQIGTGGAAGSTTNIQFGSQVVGSTSNFTFGIASALRGSSVAKGVFAFGTSSFGAVAGSSQYSIYNLAGMANHPWNETTIGPDVVRTALLTNFSGLESVYPKSITTASAWVMGDGTSSIYIPQNSNCSMTIVIAANASSKGEWWEPISWKDLTSTDFTMNRNGTTSLVKSSSSSEFNPTTGGSAGVMWRHGVYGLSTHWQSPPAIEANIGYGNAATYPKRIHFMSKAIPSAKNLTAQGTFASGAATITLSPSNTNVAVGMFVGHVSIPTGTKVAGVNTAGTSITIDQNTTAAVTSAATILFGSDNRYSKENSIAIAPSSSFYGDAPIRIKENTVLRFPMFEGRFNVRRDPAETNNGNEGNEYSGPVFLGTLPAGTGGYTTNYDPYIKYHSGFATEDNANFGHAGGQWILKGNANINASNLSIMNILQESFSGNMREGTTIGISTSYASAVPFIAITVKNRQPQKVSAFLGTGTISRATGATSEYRLSVVSTTPDAIRMEIPSMLAVPSTPTYTVTSSTSTSTFSVTFSAISIKKFGSTATKNRFVATITRTSYTGTPSVSDIHTVEAGGYTMKFSMPAFNWLTPGQILEVPGLPDGILVKLSDTDTSLWGSPSVSPQSTDYSTYYSTYPTVFNLDTVDPFWGVVGTTSLVNSLGPIEFAAYNVAAVKYSATAHVTEVR